MYKRAMCTQLLEKIKHFFFVPYQLNKHSKYEVGHTYWCGYWHKMYKVLEVISETPLKVKVEWEDGKVAEHSTSLDIRHDYELKPFEYVMYADMHTDKPVINSNISFTAAEIKALCYNGIIDRVTVAELKVKYFDTDHTPNDYTYYFLDTGRSNEGAWAKLSRDLKKCPHNFYNIKTVEDLLNDTRITQYRFFDNEGHELRIKNGMVPFYRCIPEFVPVLKLKHIDGRKYSITIDAYQRNDKIYVRYDKGDVNEDKAYVSIVESLVPGNAPNLLMITPDGREYLD